MIWEVRLTKRAFKQTQLLSKKARLVLRTLVEEMELVGPAPGKHWRHYGKLYSNIHQDQRHCHLKSGKPTYVCCWEVSKTDQVIEIYYVGTHEKAPY
jgi:mRNA-degrading endonuclease RelE of RelBE toxin-antitoxin system